jgi:hypothetical protein
MPRVKALESRRVSAWSSVAAFLLLGIACSFVSGPGEIPSPSPTVPSVGPTQPAEATQPSQATEPGSPTGVEVTCANVHFWLDPSLASGVTCETIPAVPETGDVSPWEVGPEHVRITFEDYVLPQTFHVPRIYVYPVAEYESLQAQAAQLIAELEAFLASPPQTFDETIPFLPPFNAAQFFRTQVRYVSFQDGTGVRFLTLYGQALRVINNYELFYTFQGLTQDGAFYAAAVLPVSHPSLPEDGEIPPDQLDTFAETFEAYLETSEQSLEVEVPASFTPDLALLDAMIQSLEVQ